MAEKVIFLTASVSPGGPVKAQAPWSHEFLVQQVWGGPGEFAFLTRSQVTLVWQLHFENHWRCVALFLSRSEEEATWLHVGSTWAALQALPWTPLPPPTS